jgi:hypothetical protein
MSAKEMKSTEESPRPSGQEVEVEPGVLTAGDIDDNLNLRQFTASQNKMLQSDKEGLLPSIKTRNRVVLRVLDSEHKPVSNAKVIILADQKEIVAHTRSDGYLYLYPSLHRIHTKQARIRIVADDTHTLDRNLDLGTKSHTFRLKAYTNLLPLKLDLMFVIDTTGSMMDELAYIRRELDDIVTRIKGQHHNVNIRLALVVYRDVGDEYVVKEYDFTNSMEKMQSWLSAQKASGGGDYPEAVERALEEAYQQSWRTESSAKVLFFIADAPAHDQHLKKAFAASKEFIAKGIRVYPIGASGVAEKAEYLMRSIALISGGRYLFLTDDSGVGLKHKEPESKCYQVTKLNGLIERVILSELAGKRVEPQQEDIIRRVGEYKAGRCLE